MSDQARMQNIQRSIEQLTTDLRYYRGAVERTEARIRALETEARTLVAQEPDAQGAA